jgi:hypothetical protein
MTTQTRPTALQPLSSEPKVAAAQAWTAYVVVTVAAVVLALIHPHCRLVLKQARMDVAGLYAADKQGRLGR